LICNDEPFNGKLRKGGCLMPTKELEYKGRKLVTREYANGWQVEVRPQQGRPIKQTTTRTIGRDRRGQEDGGFRPLISNGDATVSAGELWPAGERVRLVPAKIRPDVGAALTASCADEMRLKVGQPNVIRRGRAAA
jgi:hypothetical protein